MPLYFFDTPTGDDFLPDEEGLVLSGIEAARDQATAGLATMARDAIPGAIRRELAVEVKDENRRPLLRAALWFEVAVLVS